MKNKDIPLIIVGTLTVLLIPLAFNWDWTASDFVIAGVLIFGTALLLNQIRKKMSSYRLPFAVLVIFLFVWLWAELAVGIFTNWGS
ncbi:hypothetical protein K2X96_01300 [Patescibacteria group bacterium]|nr:hypothetical protein [Patescibacteria group bacterium]